VIFRRSSARGLAAYAAAAAALSAPVPAHATPNVAMDSAVYVERLLPGNVRQLEPAQNLRRGDRIVTILSWHRLGGDGGFVITNPLPRAISYQESARADEVVSVDGGRNWGKLGALRIGSRLASPEDVTHVRWRITPGSALSGRGHIAYSGIVR